MRPRSERRLGWSRGARGAAARAFCQRTPSQDSSTPSHLAWTSSRATRTSQEWASGRHPRRQGGPHVGRGSVALRVGPRTVWWSVPEAVACVSGTGRGGTPCGRPWRPRRSGWPWREKALRRKDEPAAGGAGPSGRKGVFQRPVDGWRAGGPPSRSHSRGSHSGDPTARSADEHGPEACRQSSRGEPLADHVDAQSVVAISVERPCARQVPRPRETRPLGKGIWP